MITIKERDRIVDALFREFNRGGAMPNTWAIFKRMRALIISMSTFTGVHDHLCPCGEDWVSTKFDRVNESVVIIDGKHYRTMSDTECAEHIWGQEK